jgi:hypothetical protein
MSRLLLAEIFLTYNTRAIRSADINEPGWKRCDARVDRSYLATQDVVLRASSDATAYKSQTLRVGS